MGSNLSIQHLLLSQTLPHMRNQAAVFEDGEDLHREGGEVIRITFVDHDPIFEVDQESVTLSIASIPSSSSITGKPLLTTLCR